MIRTTQLLTSVGLTLLAFASFAAEHEPPERYIYASYLYCEGSGLDRIDEITDTNAPIMDKLVDDGTIQSWGWLAHHTGGTWRRISYSMADSLDSLLDAQDAIGEALSKAKDAKKKAADSQKACPEHDDYIWQSKAGMLGQVRGKAGLSVYHICDIAREERADEIVAEYMAPILDKLVDDGKLTSWGWSSHIIGGKYRRLQTMTASDHKSLLAARGEAISAMYDDDNEAGAEFTEICGPHTDYLWDILHEKP